MGVLWAVGWRIGSVLLREMYVDLPYEGRMELVIVEDAEHFPEGCTLVNTSSVPSMGWKMAHWEEAALCQDAQKLPVDLVQRFWA